MSRSSEAVRSTAALLALALAVASPASARAEEPSIDEVDYNPAVMPPDGARSRLLWTGAALTVGWYGAAVGTSFLWDEAPNARRLRLPVVGPWAALGEVRCGSRESSCSTGTVVLRTALAVVSGIGQIGGLAVLAEGAFFPTAPPASGSPPTARRASDWLALPVVAPDRVGIDVVGRF
jgi:hypothetical protein